MKHFAVTVGLTVPVFPYVGLNGHKYPSLEEVQALVLPVWQDSWKRWDARRMAVQEARRVLREAGLHEQAESLRAPEFVDPQIEVRPRIAEGNYTVDPFTGWTVA